MGAFHGDTRESMAEMQATLGATQADMQANRRVVGAAGTPRLEHLETSPASKFVGAVICQKQIARIAEHKFANR